MSNGDVVSESYPGPPDDGPYVPSWCYDDQGGPRMCACGCHEGYHNDDGACLRRARCNCHGARYAPSPGGSREE